jgi:hypothetical protein
MFPVVRGLWNAREGIKKVFAVAERFPLTCLVSAYGTGAFWRRFGFDTPKKLDEALQTKMMGYGSSTAYLGRNNDV